MNGQSEEPVDSVESVKGAELCPKCLGLVTREDERCKHCGELVFPKTDFSPLSSEEIDAFPRTSLLVCAWINAALALLKGGLLAHNWMFGYKSSWRECLGFFGNLIGTILLAYVLRSSTKRSGGAGTR